MSDNPSTPAIYDFAFIAKRLKEGLVEEVRNEKEPVDNTTKKDNAVDFSDYVVWCKSQGYTSYMDFEHYEGYSKLVKKGIVPDWRNGFK